MNKYIYILVTASTKGLGLEIAKELSFARYNIILAFRSKKNLNIHSIVHNYGENLQNDTYLGFV